MNKTQIRDYILKYKNKYTKQQIITSLINSGFPKLAILEVYKNLEYSRVESLGKGKSKFPIITTLLLISIIISLIILSI